MQYETIKSIVNALPYIPAPCIKEAKTGSNRSVIMLCDGNERLVLSQPDLLKQVFYGQLDNDASVSIRFGKGIIGKFHTEGGHFNDSYKNKDVPLWEK